MRFAFLAPGDSAHLQPWISKFAEVGHEIVLWAYPPVTVDHTPARVTELDTTRGVLSRWRQLATLLRSDRPDVVVAHFVNVDLAMLTVFSAGPVIASVWGSDILRNLERFTKRILISSGLRRSVLVISPAVHMTERLKELGVPASRIVTAQYGVDTEFFSPNDQGLRARSVRVVCTRSFYPVYRMSDIVSAMALSRSSTGRWVLAGDGPLLDAVRDQASRQELGAKVEFPGRLGRTELRDLLRNSDIYVSASESDGASLSLMEAMACGLPCVVSDIPANREWIDESCGALFPVGDAAALAASIDRIAIDAELRRTMGREARGRVEARGDLAKNMRRILDAVERSVGE